MGVFSNILFVVETANKKDITFNVDWNHVVSNTKKIESQYKYTFIIISASFAFMIYKHVPVVLIK